MLKKLCVLSITVLLLCGCSTSTEEESTTYTTTPVIETIESTVEVVGTIKPVSSEETSVDITTDETVTVPVCDTDGIDMTYAKDENGSPYTRTEGCIHHTFGTDRVWYQDYNCYWYCSECGNRYDEVDLSVEVDRECFGHDY